MKTDQIVHSLAIITVLAIFSSGLAVCIDVASAQIDEEEIEWLAGTEYTLYWGDQINSSGYVIESLEYSTPRYSDVPEDYVMLSILSNTSESWSTILSVNNSQIPSYDVFDSKLKIEVTDVVTGIDIPTPYSEIKVYLAKGLTLEEYLERTWINTTIHMEKAAGGEIYVNERSYVTIEVENLKDIDFEDVQLNETLPDDFIVDPDADIDWTFDLEKNGKVSFRYGIRSTKAGTITIPASELILTHLGILHYKYTDTYQLVVHGPTINITKSVITSNVSLNDVVNITIDVANSGDRASHVEVTDEIPAGAVLVSGKTSDDLVLQPSDNLTLQYSIRIDRGGDILIPSAKVKFLDAKGYSGNLESKKMIISVIDESIVVEETVPVEVEPEPESELDTEPVQEDVEISQPITETEEPVVETEQSLVDKVKSLPSKAMELPGFSALGFVFAILSAGAVAGANTVDKDKRKK